MGIFDDVTIYENGIARGHLSSIFLTIHNEMTVFMKNLTNNLFFPARPHALFV